MQINKTLPVIESHIEKMPAFPATAGKVIEICNDEETSAADLNKIISLDPVLTGKLLKLVNSTYFGLPHEIISLVRAIILLGMNTVKNMVLGTAIISSLSNRKNFKALDMDAFWRHSIGVGTISKFIAKKRNVSPKKLEEYFIAGLLHDIGKIPLNSSLSKKYMSAIEVSEREQQPLYISEKTSFEFDHTLTGKLIAEKWRLGPEIKDTIIQHHCPDKYKGNQKEILYTVILANYFANISNIGFSGDRYPEKVVPKIFKELFTSPDITIDFFEDIADEVNLEIEKAQIFLQIAG